MANIKKGKTQALIDIKQHLEATGKSECVAANVNFEKWNVTINDLKSKEITRLNKALGL